VTDLRPLKHELERLVLARGDIASAAATWRVLNAHEELRAASLGRRSRHISWDDAWWGFWTGAVVSYARPFMQSRSGMTLGKRWWGRIADEDARVQHAWVMNYRNILWAHTEKELLSARQVRLSWEGVVEQRNAFDAPLNFSRLIGLCDYWTRRFDERIVQLTDELRLHRLLPPRGAESLRLVDLPDEVEDGDALS
jgi:hypothetical protein